MKQTTRSKALSSSGDFKLVFRT